MKKKLICSSPSLEGITVMINKYYCSTYWVVRDDLTVYNTKLDKVLGEVVEKRGKYYYYNNLLLL